MRSFINCLTCGAQIGRDRVHVVQDALLVLNDRVEHDDHGALQVAQEGGHLHGLSAVDVAVHQPEARQEIGVRVQGPQDGVFQDQARQDRLNGVCEAPPSISLEISLLFSVRPHTHCSIGGVQ